MAHRDDERRLKVVLISPEYTPALNGGVGTHVYELANGLAAAGHQVTVLSYSAEDGKKLELLNLQVHLVPSRPRAAGTSIVNGILAFNDELAAYGEALIENKGLRPDIIAYFNWVTFRAALRLGQRFSIPVLGLVEFLHEPVERWWGQTPDAEMAREESAMMAGSAELITVSSSMKELLCSHHGIAGNRIHLVHSGLDPQRFMRPALSSDRIARLRQAVVNGADKVVIYAGRLNPQKGISAVFQSAATVLDAMPNVRFLIVGETDSREYDAEVEEMAGRLGPVKQRVKLLGKLPREQLAILYQVADVAVMPSIFEPFGYVVIETLAAGVPAVATDQGGFHDVIENGVTGLLTPVRSCPDGRREVDVDELASAQLSLLADGCLRKRIGEAGRARVLSDFTMERMTDAMVRVYRGVISGLPAAAASEVQP